jgi:hypothetical protein
MARTQGRNNLHESIRRPNLCSQIRLTKEEIILGRVGEPIIIDLG